MYSFKALCAPLPAGAENVVYVDNLGRSKDVISLERHAANLKYFQERTDVYFQFPAILNNCHGDRADLLSNETQLTALRLPRPSRDPFSYMHVSPAYVRLRSGDGKSAAVKEVLHADNAAAPPLAANRSADALALWCTKASLPKEVLHRLRSEDVQLPEHLAFLDKTDLAELIQGVKKGVKARFLKAVLELQRAQGLAPFAPRHG